jgi:hypothetical protein
VDSCFVVFAATQEAAEKRGSQLFFSFRLSRKGADEEGEEGADIGSEGLSNRLSALRLFGATSR